MTASAYGTAASYFGASGSGTGGSGGGGASLTSTATQSQGAGSSGDAVQGGNASSGSGWISAAVSQTSSDKSAFSTPFSQWFGGISNNQIINSPGATGASTAMPYNATGGVGAGGAQAASPTMLIAVILVGVALILYAKGR